MLESNMSISISGRIAQFGSRIIKSVNNKLFDQFTQNFSKLIQHKYAEETVNTSFEAEPVKAE